MRVLKNEFFNIPSDLPLFTIHFEEDPLRGVCCEKGLDFSMADVLQAGYTERLSESVCGFCFAYAVQRVESACVF